MPQSSLEQALDALCESHQKTASSESASRTADPNDPGSSDFSLYEQEYRTMRHAEQMVQMLEVVSRGVQDLASSYRDGLRAQQRLIRMSDRLQANLQSANRALQNKTAELLRLNNDLGREIEERLRLSRELERVAREDMLTGLLGRRAILERGEQLLREHRAAPVDGPIDDAPGSALGAVSSRETALAVAVLDIDHFKQINDTLGHAGGDLALMTFAKAVRRALETGESVGRLGGEEFLLLMPVKDAEQAIARAEAVNLAVRLARFRWEGREQGLSASVGVTLAPPGVDVDIDACIREADRALYEAKRTGRDRTVFRALNGSRTD